MRPRGPEDLDGLADLAQINTLNGFEDLNFVLSRVVHNVHAALPRFVCQQCHALKLSWQQLDSQQPDEWASRIAAISLPLETRKDWIFSCPPSSFVRRAYRSPA